MYSTKSIEQTEHILGTGLETGLTQEQAKQRLQKYGENRLKEKKKQESSECFCNS